MDRDEVSVDEWWRAIRPDVRWFSLLMELALQDNDWKGGWIDEEGHAEIRDLFSNIQRHIRNSEIDEFQVPLSVQEKVKELNSMVDIANYAMMIADILNHQIYEQTGG